jgi:hypothetical protein
MRIINHFLSKLTHFEFLALCVMAALIAALAVTVIVMQIIYTVYDL